MPFSDALADVVYQLVGGLHQSMFYVGARTVGELKERGRFVRITAAGLKESHPHDVQMTVYTSKILCRPMRVTDVILEPGEVVTSVFPGDTARWTFVPGRSGSGENERLHVMIKPLMADISTNLVVTTDRRTYNVDLVSVPKKFMASARCASGSPCNPDPEGKASSSGSRKMAFGYTAGLFACAEIGRASCRERV